MKPLRFCYIICLGLLACHSSGDKRERSTLFTLQDNKTIGIEFSNDLTDQPDANIFFYRNYYNGGGVAIGDVNNDGWNDVFLTSNQGDNKLYINKGNWQFDDVSETAGIKGTKYWSTGVTMADVNADGWLDIYVCNNGDSKGNGSGNELYINQQNGTFRESAAAYNLLDGGLTTHASFFDYDLDGDLDCYVLNNSFRPIESFDFNKDLRNNRDKAGGDRLYRNEMISPSSGGGRGEAIRFTDVTDSAGIYTSDIGFGLGVSVADINHDGYPDLYIANDFFEKDYLYINQKNGTFKEGIESAVGHLSLSSMGGDIADINNDGNYDIFTTEMLPGNDERYKLITSFESYNLFKIKQREGYYNQYMQNCLQVSNGDGTFSELAFYAGIAATDWSWGALLFDMDNDGWKDIFVCNGIFKDLTNQDYIDFLSTEDNLRKVSEAKKFDPSEFIDKMSSTAVPNYAFSNNRNLTFSDKAAEFGLNQPSFSNGAAYGDLDNDGDNDLIVNNVNMPLFVYKNNVEKKGHHSISLQLSGDSLNRFGIGSTVRVYTGNASYIHYHQPDHGFQSSTAPGNIIIGTGLADHIDSLLVIWPDGNYSTYKDLKADSLYKLNYTGKSARYDFNKRSPPGLLTDITTTLFDSIPVHREDLFIDYDHERLMLQTSSTANPYMAAGDINNDGLSDFYYGGSKGSPARIFVQNAAGKFKEYIPADFKQQVTENAGAAFADFDKDGDQDLVVAHGGNEQKQGSATLHPAYYENDGRGNLSFQPAKQIPASVNASVVLANDFDKDGDPDLFIGGLSIPGSYGSSPPSYFFRNDNGLFTDISKNVFGDPAIGMVTDAKWADLDKDGFDELIIAGHWMSILVYKNNKGTLERTAALEKYKGWWNSLAIADVNEDGNPDIIAGNLGLNSKLKASFLEPMKIYIKDFDENGTKESILSCFQANHKRYVFHQRRDLADQMPSFKKEFLRYADYAGKEFSEIFPESATKDAEMHEINVLETTLFTSKGNMQFEAMPLPAAAQLSLVNTILVDDIDRDGKNEIILAGNFTDFKPEIGRLDASYGQVFSFRNGSFTYKPSSQTGLKLQGQVRSALVIPNKKGEKYLLFGRNNDKLLIYK